MDDIAFNWPKRALQYLVIGAFLIASAWGVLTWDRQNAADLFQRELTFITKPMVNLARKRIERVVERAFGLLKESPPAAVSPR